MSNGILDLPIRKDNLNMRIQTEMTLSAEQLFTHTNWIGETNHDMESVKRLKELQEWENLISLCGGESSQ